MERVVVEVGAPPSTSVDASMEVGGCGATAHGLRQGHRL